MELYTVGGVVGQLHLIAELGTCLVHRNVKVLLVLVRICPGGVSLLSGTQNGIRLLS